jgi:hypothetical protein
MRVSCWNALKFLQWGVQERWKEVEGPMLGEGLPEEKLQKPYHIGE